MDVLIRNSWIIPAFLLLFWIVFFIYRINKNAQRLTRLINIELVFAAVLAIFTGGVGFVTQDRLWHSLSVASMDFSLFFLLLIAEQLRRNTVFYNVIMKRHLVLTTLLAAIGSTLTYQGHCSLDAFIGNISFPSSRICYISYLIDSGFRSYLLGLTILLYWKNLQQNRDLIYTIRRLCCIVGSFSSFACIATTEILLVLALFRLNIDRGILKILYRFGNPVTLFLLLFGFTTPQPLMWWMTEPVRAYSKKKVQKEQELLSYLHEKMIWIVPSVRLSIDQRHDIMIPVHDIRIIIEVSDARQIIWSHQQHTTFISAREEALLVIHLLQKNIVLNEAGPHLPPLTWQHNVTSHNITVAKYLKQLESKQIK